MRHIDIESLLGPENMKRIALAYDDAPDEFNTINEEQVHALRRFIAKQFSFLTGNGFYFDFTSHDPYDYVMVKDLLHDYHSGILKINSTGNDSPLWGPVYNLNFRALHDYIHCHRRLNFNYNDEIYAFLAQLEYFGDGYNLKGNNNECFPFYSQLYWKVLRSEIVYQAAVKEYFGIFHLPVQKIILSDL